MTKYPLAAPSWDESEYQALQAVIDSGQFSMGRYVKEFEAAMAKFLGSEYCVMVNSGSSANLLMIASLFYRDENPLKRGDEVIVPAVSWSTTYFPLHQYGLRLRFVDIDRATLNFDTEKLVESITEDTKAILAVNLLGNPNDFKVLESIAAEHDLVLLEDNCESLGATYNGKQAGTFGTMGSYSSFFSHHISTMEGGIVATDDGYLYETLLSLRAHGWTRNLPQETRICGRKSDDPFHESFRFVLPGYNLRPLEMSGAVGIEQLKKLPSFVQARRENAKIFKERFGTIPHIQIQEEIGESSWFGFSMVVDEGAPVDRARVLKELVAADIDVRPIVSGNFARSEAMRWIDWSASHDLENADYIDKNGFMVGNHHFALEAEIELLADSVESAMRKG